MNAEMKEWLVKIGANVRRLREEKNMTQDELAAAIGKQRQSIQNVENGDVNQTVKYMVEVAFAMGVTFDRIFEGL